MLKKSSLWMPTLVFVSYFNLFIVGSPDLSSLEASEVSNFERRDGGLDHRSSKNSEGESHEENSEPQPDLYGYVGKVYSSVEYGVRMPYRLFVPEDYSTSRKYPLVLFLHGGGRMGTDNIRQVKNNQGAMCWVQKEVLAKHPAIVVAPQMSKESGGWIGPVNFRRGSYSCADLQLNNLVPVVFELLDTIEHKYNIDASRIYVTGQSLGGIATWYIAMKYPDKVTAVAPVCGAGDPQMDNLSRELPIWAFHGAKDPTIPVSGSREMVNAFRMSGNKHVRYSEYPDVDHNAWDRAYQDDLDRDGEIDLIEWMFAQRRKE